MESLHGEEPQDNAPESVPATTPDNTQGKVATQPQTWDKPVQLADLDFFRDMAINLSGATQCIVTWGRNQQPNDHLWHRGDFSKRAAWMAAKAAERKPGYFTPAAYADSAVARDKGRSQANVIGVRSLWVDVEGSPKKYAKEDGPEKGYRDGTAAAIAVRDFAQTTGLVPTHIVSTGSGGIHLHYVFDQLIAKTQWCAFAQRLVLRAKDAGFKIDSACTINSACIMRAPGSLHQDTGRQVTAWRWRKADYTPEEFARLAGVGAAEYSDKPPAGAAADADINAEAIGTTHFQYSYVKAAERCGAMRQAAAHNGRDTPYPVWLLMLVTAKRSTEGVTGAHDFSSGDEGYDEAETDKKLDSLTGGPATCDAWANAYGAGGPCDTCEWRGKIKTPAVLGRIVDTSAPGVATDDAPTPDAGALDEVRELNKRHALVRVGSKIVAVDFRTPYAGAQGITYGMGYLDIAAFRTRYAGQFAPLTKPGDRARPLADTWLSHPQRRQYDGVVFSPGEPVPPNILNLWQGFAVVPEAGDVSPWLRLLDALVPDASTRRYVLMWLAWKVQNPGGVPDTVLVFTGGKGTGKNSLFAPLLTAFGRHAMLADDPELIAGRFTHHLMNLAFGVLDEAVFPGDPRLADQMKSRITARHMLYEQKGFDPVPGINRCAYVMLTNHAHAWQATTDERRAVVIEVGDSLRGDHAFWTEYHQWANGPGPAALLHYLQGLDVSAFNPRAIPRNDALQRQIEMTALRDPLVSWWHGVLDAGAVTWTEGGVSRRIELRDDAETEVPRGILQLCYEQSPAARGWHASRWPAVSRRVRAWTGGNDTQRREPGGRVRFDVLPPLPALRTQFSGATGTRFD